jgi:uncharacterized protein (TIGR00369 family)
MTLEAEALFEPDVAGVAAMLGPGSLEAALGMRLCAIRPECAELEAPLGPGLLRPDGRVDPLLVAVLADCASGIPVFAREGRFVAGVTAELRVDHIAAPAADAGRLLAEGRALRVGRDGGQAAVTIRDDRGTVVAVAVAVMARSGGPSDAQRLAATGPRSIGMPFDVLGPDAPGPGPSTTAHVSTSPALANSFGAVHGGVVMAVAQVHQERFLSAEGRADQHTGITVEYLRPALGEGITVRTSALRRGARFCSLRTEMLSGAGVVVARAHGLASVADLG